ncbi:MAG: FtsX-like permease family protein [Ruminococcus sp.]|nr:FtsX-like permease family protein [Ruminococcus sp.]
MERKRLNVFRLSYINLRGDGFRTGVLIFVVAVLSFSLLVGSIISNSLANGLETAKARLGADIAVIPAGHEAEYEGVILSGEPIRFYFDKSVQSQLVSMEGIEKAAGQFFLTSISSECCSEAVQIIGIDLDTDFVTTPWISNVYKNGLRDGQIIVGSDVYPEDDGTVTFYNVKYDVVAQLEKSSTGMDYSVFTTENTVRDLAKAAHELGLTQTADLFDTDVDNSLSVVHLKLAEGYDTGRIVSKIRREIDGIDIVRSSKIFEGISDKLGIFSRFIGTISWAIWLLAAAVLSALYAFGVNARKREFAVLRLLGATRKRVVALVFCESVLVSVFGSIIGLSLAALIVFPFSTYIGGRLGLPFLLPNSGHIAAAFLFSLIVSLASGTVSAVFAAIKLSRAETYITMREGE